jgi:hypothetical protein
MAGSNIVIDLGQPAKSVETTAAEITVERLQPTLRIVAKLGDLKGRSAALTWIE